VESGSGKQVEMLAVEWVRYREGLESRMEELGLMVENEFRKELDRQKGLSHSIMADFRVKNAQIQEDISRLGNW
jgi:hypothetical protein